MQSMFWLLLWLLLFAGTSTPAAAPPEPSSPANGSAITLAYGTTTKDASGDLALTFTDVGEDSRCPTNVACVWSGMVVIALDIQADGHPAQTVKLGGMTDSEGHVTGPVPAVDVTDVATLDGYTVQLLTVTPYPTGGNTPPTAQDYQVQLLVQADGS